MSGPHWTPTVARRAPPVVHRTGDELHGLEPADVQRSPTAIERSRSALPWTTRLGWVRPVAPVKVTVRAPASTVLTVTVAVRMPWRDRRCRLRVHRPASCGTDGVGIGHGEHLADPEGVDLRLGHARGHFPRGDEPVGATRRDDALGRVDLRDCPCVGDRLGRRELRCRLRACHPDPGHNGEYDPNEYLHSLPLFFETFSLSSMPAPGYVGHQMPWHSPTIRGKPVENPWIRSRATPCVRQGLRLPDSLKKLLHLFRNAALAIHSIDA